MRGRDQDHREVGRLGQFGDRGVGLVPEHLAGAARHRVDPAGEAVLDQLMRQPPAQRLVGRGADDGDAVGRQQGAKIGHRYYLLNRPDQRYASFETRPDGRSSG